jgi:hypothetical protein
MIDNDRECGIATREFWHITKMSREDSRQFEQDSVLLEKLESAAHLRPENPVPIRLRVDEVAHGAELRPRAQLT